ncbi:MAG TPA: STAUR_1299 family protein [Thermoanaerobaculia bacterium]|nr:STAUR_1299 family protein [Thermoanaerobaculia bacterium]
MSEFRDLLRERSSEIVPGSAYNELRRRRSEARADGDREIFYEVLVPATGAWPAFRDAVFPPFVRWLRARKRDPESPRGVTVAAFLGDRCHLIDGASFLGIVRQMEGLGGSALHFRVLQWLDG